VSGPQLRCRQRDLSQLTSGLLDPALVPPRVMALQSINLMTARNIGVVFGRGFSAPVAGRLPRLLC
jgi:hypothetical protein